MDRIAIVREAERGVEMVQRSMMDALRQAMAALQDGQFTVARDVAAPWIAHPSGALLHAIASGGAGDVATGAAAMSKIAQANPGARHPVHDLVDLLWQHDRMRLIIPNLLAALEQQPGNPALLVTLGNALAELGPIEEATEVFKSAATLDPSNPAGLSNWAKSLTAQGRFVEAESVFAAAMALAPADAQIALNRSIAMLRSGQWREAWPLFHRRHALPGRPGAPPGPELTDLEAVAGQTILLVHSEGFGDTLQFIRYAPLLAERGATVLAWVPPPLIRLLDRMPEVRIVTGPQQLYDAWCRISDLPAVFGTTPATIPAAIPYLAADPADCAHWAERLPFGRRVGLVWEGAARTHDPAAVATDRTRSIPPARLAPLLTVPSINWINLQAGEKCPVSMFDPMPWVSDFADTAAIIASLDLVVSVDTAVAHLAGALGRPVLLLDRYDHCWRWLSGRTDSPWYPGLVRILRQPSPGDWPSVIAKAADALRNASQITPADTL